MAAKTYDRGVGFFSSGWIRVAAEGLLAFAENGGRARWVTSPILDPGDWDALYAGDVARFDPIVRDALLRNVGSLRDALKSDILGAIAWMVADGVLEFRLAVPREKLAGGEFHDKFGVFGDTDGNHVSFNGSYNDSIQGLRNYESIRVFSSWEPAFRSLVEADANRFARLWSNHDPNVQIFDLPEAVKHAILKLRSDERPYRCPPWIVEPPKQAPVVATGVRVPRFEPPADFEPRDYQKAGMQKWLDAKGRGILAMATGSGKTLTALYLAYKVAERVKPLVIIVVCPFINLANQWTREMRRFGLAPVSCFGGRREWEEMLATQMSTVAAGSSPLLSIVVSNKTFLSDEFQTYLRPESVRHFLIADEMHNLGAPGLQRRLNPKIQYRLGLSATPERHHDAEGSSALRNYFGEVVYELDIGEAIRQGILCRYQYFPVLVDLTPDEGERYWSLTQQIKKYAGGSDDDEMSDALKLLLIQRSRLLASARGKIPALQRTVNDLDSPVERAIVYCGDGRVEADAAEEGENVRQVDAVLKMLGTEQRLRVRKFTCDESSEDREEMLTRLRNGDLDAVVAIRCLDEGIDVPDIRQAFILASSTNPRQFVQRRGRLLRKAPGKHRAQIWDFIIRPPAMGDQYDAATFNVERGLFLRELKRIVEFCQTAENGDHAANQLHSLRKQYNLLAE